MDTQEILTQLQDILFDAFEIDPQKVQMQAHLFTDLDLDSIDAVDLAIKVQEMTGKRIKPDEFKNVRTVQDVIEMIQQLQAA
jgi:acyl carrier protein